MNPEHEDDLGAPFAAAEGVAGGLEAERVRERLAREMFEASPDPVQLGRFRVLERLGAGGMGIVYRAVDPTLDRAIALKVLRSETTAPDAKNRLLREAKAMASVRHPNLVTVHEVGEEGAHVFIAMELVAGGTLRAWMAESNPRWVDVFDIMLEAGRGLAALHAKELVHRDIKPDNVLLDEEGHAMLADFGLARPLRLLGTAAESQPSGDGTAVLESLTATGAVVGTPAYMAPEQLDGSPADARADQFSFCAVFFEALYGQRPFDAESVSELQDRLARGRPSVPERARVGSVPRWLQTVVLRGLSVRPENRYASMQVLLDELSRRRRRPVRAVAAALGAGLVATAAWFGTCGVVPPNPCERVGEAVDVVYNPGRRDTLERAFMDAGVSYAARAWDATDSVLTDYAASLQSLRREACEASLLRGERSPQSLDVQMRCFDRRVDELRLLVGVLSEGESQTVKNSVQAVGQLAPPKGCLDVEALASLYPVPDDERERAKWLEARETVALLKVVVNLGYPDRAAALAERAAELAEALGHPPLIAETTYFMGTSAALQGKTDLAIERFKQAFDQALAANFALYQAWSAITLVLSFAEGKRDLENSAAWADTAAAALERLGDDPMAEAAYHTNVATMKVRAGELSSAREHLEAAIEVHERAEPKLVYGLPETLATLASVERREGNLDAAIERYQEARALYEERMGEDHPMVGRFENSLGAVYFAQGDLDAAEKAWQRSLENMRRTLAADHPSLGHPYNNLGEVAARRGEHGTAIESFDHALKLWAPLGKEHPDVGHARLQRASSLIALGRVDEAESELRSALVALGNAPPPKRVQARFSLAKLLRARDPQSAEATRLAEDALDEIPEGSPARAVLEKFIEAG